MKPMAPAQEVYRREGGWHLIELTLEQPAQLFNSLDPAPFRQRDLDPDAAEYIVDAVRELHGHGAIKLVVHLPDISDQRVHGHVAEAVAHYFRYQEQATRLKVRNTLRLGRASLAVGLLFLAACVAGAQLIFTHDNVLSDLLHEGLLIVGWVAMWRPIQIYLHDWWPVRRRGQALKKLSEMPVEVVRRTPA